MNDESSSPAQYQFPVGFHLVRCFPAVGECAFAQLWWGDAVWAELYLRGVDLEANGDARVQAAALEVQLFPPPEDGPIEWWTFGLDETLHQLSAARDWLIENERQRIPSDEQGRTAAGAALDKAADDRDLRPGDIA